MTNTETNGITLHVTRGQLLAGGCVASAVVVLALGLWSQGSDPPFPPPTYRPPVAAAETGPAPDRPNRAPIPSLESDNVAVTFISTETPKMEIERKRFDEGKRIAREAGAQATVSLLQAMQTRDDPDWAQMAGMGTALAEIVQNVSGLPVVTAALAAMPLASPASSCASVALWPGSLSPESVKPTSAAATTAQTTSRDAALSVPDTPSRVPPGIVRFAERETPPAAVTAVAIPPPPDGLQDRLSQVADQTFWVRLGDVGVPALVMFADPGCPHCAAALDRLSGPILSGQLQIRLALAPFLSEHSWDLAAEILLAADPAGHAWNMMLTQARGTPRLAIPGTGAAIGALGGALLDANLDWMRHMTISAVPHFVWQDKDGVWHQASGVQPITTFANAAVLGGDLGMHAPAAVLEMVDLEALGLTEVADTENAQAAATHSGDDG
ncbi:MAG: thioredoxin fold domain-containing protein [Rhodobacteraceae bacterium]|nr:thioredoxin fold domain-containing protein [Paracoccaceae bacterium]